MYSIFHKLHLSVVRIFETSSYFRFSINPIFMEHTVCEELFKVATEKKTWKQFYTSILKQSVDATVAALSIESTVYPADLQPLD